MKIVPIDIANQIDWKNQEQEHYEAGGIFIYPNEKLNRKTMPLNQRNVDDALRTLPISPTGKYWGTRKKI